MTVAGVFCGISALTSYERPTRGLLSSLTFVGILRGLAGFGQAPPHPPRPNFELLLFKVPRVRTALEFEYPRVPT
ncbi:hypothetical protein O3P69_016627 [Scylla paramamosain]|uniref:Secreted protein n=1 Tax=Scylla paramamosain TaxID=85552 RepID=A0AAW0SYX0_SCYPA